MSKAKANLTEFKDRHYTLGSHRNKELRRRKGMNNNLTGLATDTGKRAAAPGCD